MAICSFSLAAASNYDVRTMHHDVSQPKVVIGKVVLIKVLAHTKNISKL
jgi:hypothetical protein